jgi:FkbM family methyltransferase
VSRGHLSKAHRLLRAPRNLFSAVWDRWFPADRFLKSCASIVHVGANSGQERELYRYYNLEVTWIEPIPAVFEQLASNIKPYPKQTAIQALLTDRAGETVKLNIANNSGASSSIFDLALHKDIWPEVDYVDHVQLQTETLDRLLERGAFRLPVDAIVLDTQGSELLVLKGAETLLHQTKYIKVEAADFESYKGGATVESIEDFLGGFCFRLERKTQFAAHPSGKGYFDLLFRRSGALRLGGAAW